MSNTKKRGIGTNTCKPYTRASHQNNNSVCGMTSYLLLLHLSNERQTPVSLLLRSHFHRLFLKKIEKIHLEKFNTVELVKYLFHVSIYPFRKSNAISTKSNLKLILNFVIFSNSDSSSEVVY